MHVCTYVHACTTCMRNIQVRVCGRMCACVRVCGTHVHACEGAHVPVCARAVRVSVYVGA